MVQRKWILILTIFITVQQQIYASCLCNAKGKDECASCSGVVRPKPQHHYRPQFELPPIGDNCWCRKATVKPATFPKPTYRPYKPVEPCKCHTQTLPTPCAQPQVNYVKEYSPPADPISVSLAVQAGKTYEVPEAKLAYGFVRKPINNLPKIYISSIKEENLYALANEIITLKKPYVSRMEKSEEDYAEAEEEEPTAENYELPPSLTYKQLGYEAEQYQNPTFVPMPPAVDEAVAAPDDKVNLDLNCDFQPGSITNTGCIRKVEGINCLRKY